MSDNQPSTESFRYVVTLQCVLTPDVPNANGHIYTKEACEKIAQQCNSATLGGIPLATSVTDNGTVDVTSVFGMVTNMRCDPGLGYIADAVIFQKTPKGEGIANQLRGLSAQGLCPKLIGTYHGSLSEGRVVGGDVKPIIFNLASDNPATPQEGSDASKA